MPEFPDIESYRYAILEHFVGQVLEDVRIGTPFLLRSVEPRVESGLGRELVDVHRLGKRIALEFEDELFYVIHLMIAGRLRKKKAGVRLPKRGGLAAFDFENASMLFTEAGTKRRASLYVVATRQAMLAHDPGGLELLQSSFDQFSAAMTESNHTIKRALTDPGILSGIGNAYSDEILFEARMSPYKQTQRMDEDELRTVFEASKKVLGEWKERLIDELDGAFPDKVTAFRPEMNVHGKYGQPCCVCGKKVQRIRLKSKEFNYCAICQTNGKLLSDRSLSRLLKNDWQKTLEDG